MARQAYFWLLITVNCFLPMQLQEQDCFTRCSEFAGCFKHFCHLQTELYGAWAEEPKCRALVNATAKQTFQIFDSQIRNLTWHQDCTNGSYDFNGKSPEFIKLSENGCSLKDIFGNYWLQCHAPLKLCENIEISTQNKWVRGFLTNFTYPEYERTCIPQDRECEFLLDDSDKLTLTQALKQWHDNRDQSVCEKPSPATTATTIFVKDGDDTKITDIRGVLQNSTAELWCYLCDYKEACNVSSVEQLPSRMCDQLHACYTQSTKDGDILQRGCMHIDKCETEMRRCDQNSNTRSCVRCCAKTLCNSSTKNDSDISFICLVIAVVCILFVLCMIYPTYCMFKNMFRKEAAEE